MKNNYNILFVNLSTERIYDTPEKRPIIEPMWAEYLASMIREYNVKIFDMNVRKDLKDFLNDSLFDFVGISVSTPLVKEAKEVAELVRAFSPYSKILVGGPHISATGGHDIDYDVAVSGEGEAIIRSIVENKEYFESHNFRKIIFNSTPISSVDEIPFPVRLPRFNYNLDYNFVGEKQIFASVMTSRSCPYKCVYCASKKTFGKTMRFRTPENVIEELEELKNEYGVNSIIFLDDCFTLKRERVKKICELMIEKGLNMNWWVDTRCDHVDKELLELMKKAGCVFIVYGVEAGNSDVLKRIKKNISAEKIREAFKITKEVGIDTKCNIMIGHLDETEKEIWDSINLAKELNATRTSFYKVITLPGSELYEIAKERGLISETPDFENFAWYKNPPIISKLSKERLEELQKIAYEEVSR